MQNKKIQHSGEITLAHKKKIKALRDVNIAVKESNKILQKQRREKESRGKGREIVKEKVLVTFYWPKIIYRDARGYNCTYKVRKHSGQFSSRVVSREIDR